MVSKVNHLEKTLIVINTELASIKHSRTSGSNDPYPDAITAQPSSLPDFEGECVNTMQNAFLPREISFHLWLSAPKFRISEGSNMGHWDVQAMPAVMRRIRQDAMETQSPSSVCKNPTLLKPTSLGSAEYYLLFHLFCSLDDILASGVSGLNGLIREELSNFKSSLCAPMQSPLNGAISEFFSEGCSVDWGFPMSKLWQCAGILFAVKCLSIFCRCALQTTMSHNF